MNNLNRPVLVRTKQNLFAGVITGEWIDNKDPKLWGYMVSFQPDVSIAIDAKRIVRFTDNDEVPWEIHA